MSILRIGAGLARKGAGLVGPACIDECCGSDPTIPECGVCGPCVFPIEATATTTIVQWTPDTTIEMEFDALYGECPGVPCGNLLLGGEVTARVFQNDVLVFSSSNVPGLVGDCSLIQNSVNFFSFLGWDCIEEIVDPGGFGAFADAVTQFIIDSNLTPPVWVIRTSEFGGDDLTGNAFVAWVAQAPPSGCLSDASWSQVPVAGTTFNQLVPIIQQGALSF